MESTYSKNNNKKEGKKKKEKTDNEFHTPLSFSFKISKIDF